MATVARRRQRGVVAIHVTVGALTRWHNVRSRQRKRSLAVIERRIRPNDRVMAHFACGRKTRRGMRRVVRACVIFLMARIAGCRIQAVVVVHMAIGTLPGWHNMGTGEREASAVVIEAGIQPRCRVVALIARLREIRRDVAGIGRPLVILQVARHARSSAEIVVVVDVAVAALPRRHHVCSRQRKAGAVVVERRILPRCRVMALPTALGEV